MAATRLCLLFLLLAIALPWRMTARQVDLVPTVILTSNQFPALVDLNSAGSLVLACTTTGSVTNFWVIDASKSTPELIGASQLPGALSHAASNGRYAFVAAGELGLHVVDLVVPSNPRFIATLDTPGNAYQSIILSNTLYLADGTGLQVVDISNPTMPVAGIRLDLPGRTVDIAVTGHYAYVATETTNVHILNIQQPTTPSYLSTLSVAASGSSRDLEVKGGLAFVTMGQGLTILDISVPTAPLVASAYPYGARRVRAWRDFLFVTPTAGGVFVVDVSNPSAPQFAGTLPSPGGGLDPAHGALTIAGDRAFVSITSSLRGLVAVETRDAYPERLSAIPFTNYTLGPLFQGKSNVLVQRAGKLLTINVDDPASPTVVRTNINALQPIVTMGGNAAAGRFIKELIIYARDASDNFTLASKVPIAEHSANYNSPPFAFKDDYLFHASGAQGLNVYDLVRPHEPRLAATLTNWGKVHGIVIDQNLAVINVTTAHDPWWPSLVLLDITEPASPQFRGELDGYFSPAFTLKKGLLYVGSGLTTPGTVQTEFYIYDARNPGTPPLLGRHILARSAAKFVVADGFLFVPTTLSSIERGFEIFDVSNPALPKRVGGNSALQIADILVGKDVFFAAGGGFHTFSLPKTPGFHLGTPTLGHDNQLHFRFEAIPGEAEIFRTTDLTNWASWRMLQSSSGSYEFTDTPAPGRTFYRATTR